MSAGGRGSEQAGRRRRRTLTAYVFLAPFLILFAMFVIAPAIFGLWISLTNWSPFRDVQNFVGLENYTSLFSSGSPARSDFWQSMGATGIFVVASVPFLVVVPLLVAILLAQKIRAA